MGDALDVNSGCGTRRQRDKAAEHGLGKRVGQRPVREPATLPCQYKHLLPMSSSRTGQNTATISPAVALWPAHPASAHLVAGGQGVRRGGGQHAHELVKGLEGHAQVKGDVQGADVVQVWGWGRGRGGGEGGVGRQEGARLRFLIVASGESWSGCRQPACLQVHVGANKTAKQAHQQLCTSRGARHSTACAHPRRRARSGRGRTRSRRRRRRSSSASPSTAPPHTPAPAQ